jgi:hypothetical protein
MDTEHNKATLQRLYDEVMNGHDLDAADDLITLDRPDHDPTFPPELTTGRGGFKKLFGMLIVAFPDLHFTTQFMVAEGDLVVALMTVTRTIRSDTTIFGYAVEGRGQSYTVQHVHIYRVADGKISEHWALRDDISMLRQLGVIQAPT